MHVGSGDGDVKERRRAEKEVGRSGDVVVGNGKFNRRLLLVLLLWVVKVCMVELFIVFWCYSRRRKKFART